MITIIVLGLLAVGGTVGAMALTHSGFMGNGYGMMNGRSGYRGMMNGNQPYHGNMMGGYHQSPAQQGTYTFRCFDPCGTGPMGMMGPMMTQGYMIGTLTVQ